MNLPIVHVDHLLKTKKEFKNSKKQDIHDVFIKTNQKKLVFNMMWLMEILKIYLEKQLLIKYYVIKHLILQKIIKYDRYERRLASVFYKIFIKTLQVVMLKVKLYQTKNQLKNYTNQLLENLKNQKYTYLLKTIFGLLILLICN